MFHFCLTTVHHVLVKFVHEIFAGNGGARHGWCSYLIVCALSLSQNCFAQCIGVVLLAASSEGDRGDGLPLLRARNHPTLRPHHQGNVTQRCVCSDYLLGRNVSSGSRLGSACFAQSPSVCACVCLCVCECVPLLPIDLPDTPPLPKAH